VIEVSEHARWRLKRRKIDLSEVIDCLPNPDEILYDVKEKTFVAVKRLNGKILVVAYVVEGERVRVVTAFRSDKLNMIKNRIESGRWVKI